MLAGHCAYAGEASICMQPLPTGFSSTTGARYRALLPAGRQDSADGNVCSTPGVTSHRFDTEFLWKASSNTHKSLFRVKPAHGVLYRCQRFPKVGLRPLTCQRCPLCDASPAQDASPFGHAFAALHPLPRCHDALALVVHGVIDAWVLVDAVQEQ